MAKKGTAVPVYTAENIALGPVTIPSALLTTLPMEATSQKGVILTNERSKVTLPDANGVPVTYTLSLYIERDAMTDDERLAVATTKAERTAARDERSKQDMERLAREKREAFKLGQDSSVDALRNLPVYANAAQSLQHLFGGNGK